MGDSSSSAAALSSTDRGRLDGERVAAVIVILREQAIRDAGLGSDDLAARLRYGDTWLIALSETLLSRINRRDAGRAHPMQKAQSIDTRD
jgi:hypothetical protein